MSTAPQQPLPTNTESNCASFAQSEVQKNLQSRVGKGSSAATPCICWLGGWGLAESAMLEIVQRELPQANHRVLAPTETSLALLHRELTDSTNAAANIKAIANAGVSANANAQGGQPIETASVHTQNLQTHEPYILAGYSTGAFLLLRELARFAPLLPHNSRMLLFAPFLDFRAESGLGGRIVATRLKLLLRRLRSDPLAAIADFYAQSGITLSPPTTLPYALPDLLWGIEQLAQTAIPSQTLTQLRSGELSLGIKAWIGANDALLDAQTIATHFAPNVCRIAHNASHDLASMLAFANAEEGRFL